MTNTEIKECHVTVEEGNDRARQVDRQTVRQTNRQADRQTRRYMDRHDKQTDRRTDRPLDKKTFVTMRFEENEEVSAIRA